MEHFLFLGIYLFLILFAIGLWGTKHSTHKYMTITFSKKWDYGSYERFIKEFESVNWQGYDSSHPNSFFKGPTTQVHASVIQFDGNGMVLPFLDYIRFCYYMRLAVKQRNKKESTRKVGLWGNKNNNLKVIK